MKAALAQYRAEGCDSLVALGGGSPIDPAKGAALLVIHGIRRAGLPGGRPIN